MPVSLVCARACHPHVSVNCIKVICFGLCVFRSFWWIMLLQMRAYAREKDGSSVGATLTYIVRELGWHLYNVADAYPASHFVLTKLG